MPFPACPYRLSVAVVMDFEALHFQVRTEPDLLYTLNSIFITN